MGTPQADNSRGADLEPFEETTASLGILPRVHDAPITASDTQIPHSDPVIGVSCRSGLSPAPVRPPESSVSNPAAARTGDAPSPPVKEAVRGYEIPLDNTSVEAPSPPLLSPPVAHLPQPPGFVILVEAVGYQ